MKKLSLNRLRSYQRWKPKINDLEGFCHSLRFEYLSIDSSRYYPFSKLTSHYQERIEFSTFNGRSRRFLGYIEFVGKGLAAILKQYGRTFMVDSIPLEACKLLRNGKLTIRAEEIVSSTDMGHCAGQGSNASQGYKPNAVCSKSGVLQYMDISPVSIKDIDYRKNIKKQMAHCTVQYAKRYLSEEGRLDLFNTYSFKPKAIIRINQNVYSVQPFDLRNCRKRIEILFLQLCAQFLTKRFYTKNFEGFKIKIVSKVTALTILLD